MRWRTGATAVAGLLVLAACARVATRSGGREGLVFASERNGNTDIYYQLRDGSGLRRLTTDEAPDRQPRCSPNGRSVVFVRGDGPTRAIILIDLTTGVERTLTSRDAFDYTPTWSPDGNRIYFTRGARDGAFDRLAEMQIDGSAVRFLTDGTAHDVLPAASPDGRRLVHHSYRYERGNTELHLLDPETGASERITNTPTALDYEATFAGPGRILFSSNRDGGHFRLYELTLSSGAVRRVLDTGQDVWGARHAGGNRVLVYSGTPSHWRVLELSLRTDSVASILDERFSNSAADICNTR